MTIKEFAALAGVSASTVSKIMHGKDASISIETREHVLRLAKEYNYKSGAFGSVPGAKTLTIGVVTKHQERFDLTFPGVLSKASDYSYSLLVRDSAGLPETERKNLLSLIGMHVDGLLWEPVSPADTEEGLSLIQKSGIPFVFLSSEINRQHGLPYIDFDRMGYEATRIQLEKGHTDIACLLYDGSRSPGLLRGYRRCLFDHGITFREELIFRSEAAIRRKIGSHQFTGLVISHFSAALRIVNQIAELHYTIPTDLSVVSLHNDLSRVPETASSLSSIRIPFFEYGEYLAEHLIRRIEKKEALPPFDTPAEVDSMHSVGIPFSARMKRVLSIGSVNIDNYLNFNELPHSGTTAASSSLSVYPGGKCINQAVGAARLGQAVAVIGRVGDDADSDIIYETVKDLSINHSGLQRTDREKTGQAYIFVGKSGESMISLLAGANRSVSPQDIERNEALFSRNGYCLLQTEIPMPALIAAARLAKRRSMTTVLKPSACDLLPEELLSCIDMMIPNRDELTLLCRKGKSLEQKADTYLARGIGTVIVTLGAEGCLVRTKELSERISAIDITPVDVSGAGDAFICCLISCLIDGYDLVRAARIATYAAGISTARQGTVPALVDKATLEAYIMNAEPNLLRLHEAP